MYEKAKLNRYFLPNNCLKRVAGKRPIERRGEILRKLHTDVELDLQSSSGRVARKRASEIYSALIRGVHAWVV